MQYLACLFPCIDYFLFYIPFKLKLHRDARAILTWSRVGKYLLEKPLELEKLRQLARIVINELKIYEVPTIQS